MLRQRAFQKEQQMSVLSNLNDLLLALKRPNRLMYEWHVEVWEQASEENRKAAAKLAHASFLTPDIGQRLDLVLADTNGLSLSQVAFVQRLRELYHQHLQIEAELIEREAGITTRAKEIWKDALEANRFDLYEPILAEQVAMSREIASALGATSKRPDSYHEVLTQMSNPGFNGQEFFSALDELLPVLSLLLQEARGSANGHARLPVTRHPIGQLLHIAQEMRWQIGIPEEYAPINQRPHTFCLDTKPYVVKIGARFEPGDPIGLRSILPSGFLSLFHEFGHTCPHLSQSLGLLQAMPEAMITQSRVVDETFAECFSQVACSREFWQWFQPFLTRHLPEYGSVAPDDLYAAVWSTNTDTQVRNPVYRMILGSCRALTERALLSGALSAEDVNAFYVDLLNRWIGSRPKSAVSEIFGWVHLKTGNLVSNPSYIDARMGGAHFEAHRRAGNPNWDWEIASGDFSTIVSYLRPCYDKMYTTDMRNIIRSHTGESLNPQHLLNYYREHLPIGETL
jgi:carboxypeptidase Taq